MSTTAAPAPTKKEAIVAFNKLLALFVDTLDRGYSKYEKGLKTAKEDLSDAIKVDPAIPFFAKAAAPVIFLSREKLYDEKDRSAIISGVKNLLKSVDIDRILPHIDDTQFGVIRRWIWKLDLKLDVIYQLDADLLSPEAHAQFLAMPKTRSNPAAAAAGAMGPDNKSTAAPATKAPAAASSSSLSSAPTPSTREQKESKTVVSKAKKTKKKKRNPADELAPMLNIMNQFMGSEMVQGTLQGKVKDSDVKTDEIKGQFTNVLSSMGDQLEHFSRTIGDEDETEIPEAERQMRVKRIQTGLLGLVGMEDPSMYTDPKTVYDRELSMARDRAAKTDPNRYDTVVLYNRELVAGLRLLYENRVVKFADKFPKLKVKMDELFAFYEAKGNAKTHKLAEGGLEVMAKHEEAVHTHNDLKLFLEETRPSLFRQDGIEVPKLVRSILYYSDKARKGQPKPADDPSVLKFWKIVDSAASFLAMYRNFKKAPFAPLGHMVNDFMTRNHVNAVTDQDAAKSVKVTRETMYDAMANIGNNPERTAELRKSAQTMLREGKLEDCISIVMDTVAPQSRKMPGLANLKQQMSEMTAPLIRLQAQQRAMDAEVARVAKEAKEKGEDVDKAVAEAHKRLNEERNKAMATAIEESKAGMEKLKKVTEEAAAKKKEEMAKNPEAGEQDEDENEDDEEEQAETTVTPPLSSPQPVIKTVAPRPIPVPTPAPTAAPADAPAAAPAGQVSPAPAAAAAALK